MLRINLECNHKVFFLLVGKLYEHDRLKVLFIFWSYYGDNVTLKLANIMKSFIILTLSLIKETKQINSVEKRKQK